VYANRVCKEWTLVNKCRSSQQWELDILLTGPQQVMMEALSKGSGYAVSDGSFKDAARVAAWIIKGPTSELRLTSQWQTPGPPKGHSLFCSKVAGIVGVLYTLSFWPPTAVNHLSELLVMDSQWYCTCK